MAYLLLLLALAVGDASSGLSSPLSYCQWNPNDDNVSSNSTVSILECVVSVSDRGTAPPPPLPFPAQAASLRARTLVLRCQDGSVHQRHHLRDVLDRAVSMAESVRDPWRNLQHLIVFNCPLQQLHRLDLLFIASSLNSDLSNIEIVSSDEELSASVEPGALVDSPKLDSLTLHGLGISSLPKNVLCPMAATLTNLNLSRNALSDLNLGCPLKKLTRLDVSSNAIGRISRRFLTPASVPALSELDLSSNGLLLAEDAALDGLGLTVLNLAHNKLTSLPVDLFGGSDAPLPLTELYLSNNSLAGLPAGLLSRLTHLVVLNLSHNAVSNAWLDAGAAALAHLAHLAALDLSFNRLTFLGADAFKGLTSLQVLTVAHNRLAHIAPTAFAPCSAKLHALALSHNLMEELDEGVFRGLAKLSSLALDHNRIKALHTKVFSNLSSLHDLGLHANDLRHVPHHALAAVSRTLRTLDLGENAIKEASGLGGLRALNGLRLAGNDLTKLGAKAFVGAEKIRMLNLADNRIKEIDQDAFSPLKKLKALRIDNNRLEDLNGLLTTQHQLQWLNVSFNRLQWFDYAFIPKSLLWLNLRGNAIEELGNYYDMQTGFKIVHLDVSHNKLSRLDREAVVHSLKEIYANDNSIEELAANSFSGLSNLSLINLSNNSLSKFSLNSLAITLDGDQEEEEAMDGGRSVDLYLSGNPLECSCEMEWMQRINELAQKSPSDFPYVRDYSDLVCSLNNRHEENGEGVIVVDNNNATKLRLPVSQVRPSEFLCSYQIHCFALCMCCDFYACDCRMKCSDGCECFHDQTWSANVIQCGRRNHESVPEFIAMDATAVYLDGNRLGDISGETFIGRKHLTDLYLNSSHITLISNKTLDGLSELLVLHLENNQLAELHGGELASLVSLKELHLDHNRLSFIHPDTFAPLSELQVLTLAHNRLVAFPLWGLLVDNPLLNWVTLSENPWSCECGFLRNAQRFLRDRRGAVKDNSALKCVVNGVSSNAIVSGNATCADVMAVSFKDDSAEEHEDGEEVDSAFLASLVPILAVVVSAVVIVVSVIILAVAFRKPVASWIHARYNGGIFDPSTFHSGSSSSASSSSNYHQSTNGGNGGRAAAAGGGHGDVYVHFCARDAALVQQQLAPPLEASGLRLHLRRQPGLGGLGGEHFSSAVLAVVSGAYLSDSECAREVCGLMRSRNVVPLLIDSGDKKAARALFGNVECVTWRKDDAVLRHLRQRLAPPLPPPPPSGYSGQSLAAHSRTLRSAAAAAAAAVTAPRSADYEDDLWTYVRGSDDSSSLNTGSTAAGSNGNATSTMPAKVNKSNVIVNPLGNSSRTLRSHDYVSVNDSQRTQEEPIYHTLEPSTPEPKIYINQDLEVVYPKLVPASHRQPHRLLQMLGEREEFVDEDDELLAGNGGNFDDLEDFHGSYVPSPAPGSMPRRHHKSAAKQQPQPQQQQMVMQNNSQNGYFI